VAQTKTKQKKASSGSKTKSQSNSKAKSASKAKASGSAKPKAGSNGAAASNGSNGIVQAASKAKVPLMTGGAVLIGAASGIAYGASHPGSKVMGIKMPGSKRVKFKSGDLRKAAKDVGHFGDQVGQLTKELRKARKDSDGSIGAPVELLLRSLMGRR
jgi:hypothetical protein